MVAPETDKRVSKDCTLRLSTRKPSSIIRNVKFLASKCRYRFKDYTKEDFELLWFLLLELESIIQSDRVPDDIRIQAKDYHPIVTWILDQQPYYKDLEFQTTSNFEMIQDLFFSPRAFISLLKSFNTRIKVVRFNRKLLDGKFYEQRYVGVGYHDKGTTSVDSYDGSPGWQSVASQSQLPPLANETRSKYLRRWLRTSKLSLFNNALFVRAQNKEALRNPTKHVKFKLSLVCSSSGERKLHDWTYVRISLLKI